jgi:hypothetical protein
MPRSRLKNRKTKYLSLRRHLAPRASKPTCPHAQPPSPSPPLPQSPAEDSPPIKQANIFPIQQDPDVRDPQVASLLFSSTNGETGETLTEILGTTASASTGPVSDSCSAGSPGSPPAGLDNGEEDGDGLARRALRGRQRVEYWCMSSNSSEEEVASASVAVTGNGGGVDLWHGAPQVSLLLKLDYEEILTAWSDRGSLYIDGEPAQVVPGFHHTAFPVSIMITLVQLVICNLVLVISHFRFCGAWNHSNPNSWRVYVCQAHKKQYLVIIAFLCGI